MLVHDEHNTITTNIDWCYLATDIVVTVTHVLHNNRTNNKITSQCYDMLISLLTALPHRYTLLTTAVTDLIKELHLDKTYPDKVSVVGFWIHIY